MLVYCGLVGCGCIFHVDVDHPTNADMRKYLATAKIHEHTILSLIVCVVRPVLWRQAVGCRLAWEKYDRRPHQTRLSPCTAR